MLSSPFLNYILVKVYISVVNIGNARLRGCATRPHYQLSHNIIQAKQVAVKEKRAGFGEDFWRQQQHPRVLWLNSPYIKLQFAAKDATAHFCIILQLIKAIIMMMQERWEHLSQWAGKTPRHLPASQLACLRHDSNALNWTDEIVRKWTQEKLKHPLISNISKTLCDVLVAKISSCEVVLWLNGEMARTKLYYSLFSLLVGL